MESGGTPPWFLNGTKVPLQGLQRFAVSLGQKVHSHQQTPLTLPVQHQAGKDTPVWLGGILANTSEAAIGVALSKHIHHRTEGKEG